MSAENYTAILRRIYPETIAAQVASRISELVGAARDRVPPDRHRMSSRDVILITYGDTIREAGVLPLRTLHEFYRARLKGSINSIHILPFHPYTSDDGFAVVDYYRVNDALGDWDDIERLGADARLMFDAVVNHVSASSPWFEDYLAGDPQYADWFIEVEPAEDLSAVTRPRSSPVLSEFTGADGRKRHVWTTFSDDQIDLNVGNPEVLLALLRVLVFFVEKGAKYIRLDAIAFLWKEIGTSCIHLPQTHDIVRLMRRVVEYVSPSTLIITETNVPHKENMSYLGDGRDEAHMVYNFALPPLIAYSILTGSAEKMLEWARTLELPSDRTCLFNFTASHDGVGVRPVEKILTDDERSILLAAAEDHGGAISYKRNPDGSHSPYELNCSYVDLLTPPRDHDDLRAKRLLLSQAIALAMPGVPAIYIHSLLASRNDLEAVERTGHNRSINRSKLDIGALDDQLDEPMSLRSKVFSEMLRLLRTRCGEPAFDPYGTFAFPDIDPRVFSIVREDPGAGRRVLCLANVSGETVTISPESGTPSARDLLTDSLVAMNEISLPGYGILWLDLSGR